MLLGFAQDQPDPPACDISILAKPDCEKYFVVKGCVLTFCIDVEAAQTPNTVVLGIQSPNRALTVESAVTAPLYDYQVSPFSGPAFGIKVGRDIQRNILSQLYFKLESSETLNIGDIQQFTVDITNVPRNTIKIGQIHIGQVGNRLC